MSVHIIIDGYNLIRQSKKLHNLDQQDIQLGRERLIDMLAAYQKVKPHRITVVFDGTHTQLSSPQRDRRSGIAILFSARGESADTLIKKMAGIEREKALVVSSDQEIVRSVKGHGATTISAADFEIKLSMVLSTDEGELEGQNHEGWNPTTRKKGPRRRPAKRKRRDRVKIAKL
jgi:hypothetical protein